MISSPMINGGINPPTTFHDTKGFGYFFSEWKGVRGLYDECCSTAWCFVMIEAVDHVEIMRAHILEQPFHG